MIRELLQLRMFEMGFLVGSFSWTYREGRCFSLRAYFSLREDSKLDAEKFWVFLNSFGVERVNGGLCGELSFMN